MRKPVKTALIATIIIVGTGLLYFANAILEASSSGLQASFIGSFTGHLAIGGHTEEAYGLFGNETPIVSEYEIVPSLPDYAAINEDLSSLESVEALSPIVTAAAQFRYGAYTEKNPLFGIDPETYFTVCSDLEILSGDTEAMNNGGAFLNESMVKRIETKTGRPLSLGANFSLTSIVNGSAKLRTASYAGMYRYPAPNEALDRVVLVDASIARALCDYTAGFALAANDNDPHPAPKQESEAFDIDDLFAEKKPLQDAKEGLELADVESTLRDVARRDALVATNDAAWSFVIVRMKDPRDAASTIARLRRELDPEDYRVLDWQIAAGSSALILIAVRAILYAGVFILLLGSALVVMNSLVISVLERTEEIGSMRALGASKSFVRRQFMAETFILTGSAAIAGLLISVLLVSFFGNVGFKLDNPLLASLFGSAVLRPVVSPASMVLHFFGALAAGSLAWIYPVSLALKIQPIHAIQTE